ncbi:MAG: hypothetical protein MJ218_03535 [Opitutales bacterium]|nr:hypothetical protein [Opitutales bacterium]
MKQLHTIIMANENTFSYHRGSFTLSVKGNPITKGMLVTFDESQSYVKACGKAEYPFGIALRDATPTEGQDAHISIQPLSCTDQSARILVHEAIKAEEPLGLADNGKAKKLTKEMPFIGIALTDGTKGSLVETLTTLPQNILK